VNGREPGNLTRALAGENPGTRIYRDLWVQGCGTVELAELARRTTPWRRLSRTRSDTRKGVPEGNAGKAASSHLPQDIQRTRLTLALR
jgi:hypothetical protein